MRVLAKFIKLLFASIFTFYAIIVGFLYFNQEALLFPAPDVNHIDLPSNVAERMIKTDDGNTLYVIEIIASKDAPYILFFHGNGSAAKFEIDRGQIFRDAGYNVLLAEYRGYGGSSGETSAQVILEDALLVHDWVREKSDEAVFVAAHSLGTGAATYVAANRDIAALLLEAPYASLADVAADKYPFVPVKALFKHEINSAAFMGNIIEPVLIMHGTQDRVIPIKFGTELFKHAKPKDQFVIIEGGGHSLFGFGSPDRTVDFFNEIRFQS